MKRSTSDNANNANGNNPGRRIDYGRFLDCVHCGLCTSACPTYTEVGDENDGPRGRIYQMRLVTDGGLHHHLAASGNFGQVIRKNYPVVTAHRVAGGPREVVSVVGPLCTPLDILGDKMELGAAQVGDLMVVLQSGAYGYTASPHLFLGHPAPLQVLV